MNTEPKKLFLLLGVACALAVVGAIFLWRVPPRSSESAPSTATAAAPQLIAPPPEKEASVPPVPWVAFVDLSRILAASPRLRAYDAEHQKELPQKVQMYGVRGTNLFNMESQIYRQWVIRDNVRPVIAARAAAHKIPLVFDYSATTTNGAPAVLYSTSVNNLNELTNAPGTIDLTDEVLREMLR